MLKEAGKQSLIFGERNDAIADVAGRKHPEFLAQTSAGTAVVTHRNYRAQFTDLGRTGWLFNGTWPGDVSFKTFQESG